MNTLDLTITDVAYGGKGVARQDGLVIFVPGAWAGEKVRAQIVKRKSSFAEAVCLEILSASPDRQPVPCPYYGRCGGCQYQHVSYESQLAIKAKQVADALLRIGRCEAPEALVVIPSPSPWAYRNKMTLHGPGAPAFHGQGSHACVPVTECLLAQPPLNERLRDLQSFRLAANQDLVIRGGSEGHVIHAAGVERDRRWRTSETPAVLTTIVRGISFQYGVRSFFQVNPPVLEAIAQTLGAWFESGSCTDGIDAYAGVGVFSLLLAHRAKRMSGIEWDRDAVQFAEANARSLGVEHCRFQTGATEKRLESVLKDSQPGSTCVILDPPRTGCDPVVIRALAEARPRQILYVSCVPPILARDLKALMAGGYAVRHVQAFDMFPQTLHCEVAVELMLIA